MTEKPTALTPRPAVMRFAVEMEKVLRRNDHKGGWDDEDDQYLVERVEEELDELKQAIESHAKNRDRRVIMEAADVANLVMMIADNRSQL